MPRPTNQADLLRAASHEFDRLWSAIDDVRLEDRERPGACETWSVKDLVLHLHAWQEMALDWESVGSTGELPSIPAEGYSFAETPALNHAIYERTKDTSWDDAVEHLKRTHAALLHVIAGYDDEDLFAKKRYRWTRSTSVGAYMVSATSSHYAWASKLIRKFAKTLGSDRSTSP
ncbi:MAG: ClbS/DfsB family four-helix bundle protein [Acidimicrobiales bacterium]